MSAITVSGTDLSNLPILEIVRYTSSPEHVRYGLSGWREDLIDATVGADSFTSQRVSDFFIANGMPDFPAAFHATRAGEALGAAVEAGVIESIGPDEWRWVAS